MPVKIVIVNVEQVLGEESITPETWQQWFQIWLDSFTTQLPPGEAYELSLRLTDDEEIKQFNSQYRHLDQPTDVLAFAALENVIPGMPKDESEPVYLGDLVISLDTAIAQASAKGHSLVQELAWLATHGFLHLLGWDHPDDSSLELMLTQQEQLLNLVGLETEYLK